MNKILFFLMMIFAVFPVMWGQSRNQEDAGRVALTHSHEAHLSGAAPEAVFSTIAGQLQVTLDATHYASYRVKLTAPSGDTVAVSATSSTVTIPVTGTGDGYVVTVDGGDYGVYDGVFSRSGAAAVAISDAQALQLVKNRRQDNSGVNFYSATVNAVINDSVRCPITTPPTQAWATDTEVDKWLLFVDEHPDWGWAHECSYSYIPKTVSTHDSLVVLNYPGQLPPRNVTFAPVELNVTFTLSDFHVLPQSVTSHFNAPMMSPGASAHDTKVIIIGTGMSSYDHGISTPIYRNWNECAAMYQILTTKYGILDSDIHLFIGSENCMVYNSDFELVPMPKDLDGDGIDENVEAATRVNVESLLRQLADRDETGHFRQLFIFYTGGAGPMDYNGEADMILSLYGDVGDVRGGYLSDYYINAIDVDFVSTVFNCNYSFLMPMVMTSPNTVLVTSTGGLGGVTSSYRHPDHPEYSCYGYYWLSALAECDLSSGLPASSDLNSDGSLTFGEVFEVSDSAYTQYMRVNYDMEGHPWPYTPGYPGIDSYPLSLKDSLWLTHTPRYPWLHIRPSVASQPTQTWDSPDIWVRNQNDGLTHQESEPVKLTAEEPVYVYVRIHNNGDTVSLPHHRTLFVHVSPSGTVLDREIMSRSAPSHLIGVIPTPAIAPDTCAIVTIEWAWDEEPDEEFGLWGYPVLDEWCTEYDWETLYDQSGNVLPVRFTATLGEPGDELLINDEGLNYPDLPEYKLTFQKKSVIRPRDGKSVVVSGGMMPYVAKSCQFDIPLSVKEEGRYSIGIVADQANSIGTVLSNTFRTFFELSSTLCAAMDSASSHTSVTAVSGNPAKYRVQNANAAFNNLHLDQNHVYTLTLSCDINSSLTLTNGADWRYHVVLRDTAGNIVDGQVVRVLENPYNNIVPPGINAVQGPGDSFTLTETNVSAPARYEWYDTSMNKIDEGKTVTVSRSETGEWCVLKVTYTGGGEDFAVAHLSSVPAISQVSPVPFDGQLTVGLTTPATQGMSLRIISVNGSAAPLEAAVPAGAVEVMLSTASLPAGQYVVCLMQGSDVLQSVIVVK
ncbi:MAG: hypothetical protein IKR25_09925 [Muribaculaceae bacterium]|nr:hypothetical protein [Muribaculaceae bacterium]